MKRLMLITIFFVTGFLFVRTTAPVFAHHSTLLQSTTERVTLEGTITKIEWGNPHVFLYIDAKDIPDTGKIVNWAIETGNPKECTEKGLAPTNLKVGLVVTLKGARRRTDGHHLEASPADISWSGKPL